MLAAIIQESFSPGGDARVVGHAEVIDDLSASGILNWDTQLPMAQIPN